MAEPLKSQIQDGVLLKARRRQIFLAACRVLARKSFHEATVKEIALEAGAEDFKADPQGYEILTEAAQFESVHKQIEAKGIKSAVAAVTELPTITVPLREDQTATVNKLIEALEDHDDVKEVYSNADFSEDRATVEG